MKNELIETYLPNGTIRAVGSRVRITPDKDGDYVVATMASSSRHSLRYYVYSDYADALDRARHFHATH